MPFPIPNQISVPASSNASPGMPGTPAQPATFTRAMPAPAQSAPLGNLPVIDWNDVQNVRAASTLSALSGYANTGSGTPWDPVPFNFNHGGNAYLGEVSNSGGNLEVTVGDGIYSFHPSDFEPLFQIGAGGVSFQMVQPSHFFNTVANQALQALRNTYGPELGAQASLSYQAASEELNRLSNHANMWPQG